MLTGLGYDYGIVQHYKNKKYYVILGTSINPDNKRIHIKYLALYDTGEEFNRDHEIFYEFVTDPVTKLLTKRFNLVYIEGNLIKEDTN